MVKLNLRVLYLYLFSFVGLLIMVFGSINMVNLLMKTFIFKDVDRYEVDMPFPANDPSGKPIMPTYSKEELQARQDRDLARQHQRQFIDAAAMLLVGTPLYLYHWKTIQKEGKETKLA